MDMQRIIRKNILKKEKITFIAIVNIVLIAIASLVALIRFRELLVVVLLSFLTFLIRFRRKQMHIHLTLEPALLTGITALVNYGFLWAAISAAVPIILADLFSGTISQGSLISAGCKILVLLPIAIIPAGNLVGIAIISYIILNEGVGTVLALMAAVPIDQIMTQVITSTLIRLFYLNVFIGLMV